VTARVLIAGVGNLLFGDDGFGVVAAQRLAAAPPPDARVVDFGIRALHLAYELLEPHALAVVIDCVARGCPPGTLYVIDPAIDDTPLAPETCAHGMTLSSVFATVAVLGGRLPPLRIVGCEPAELAPGIGLSAHVERAIEGALALVRDVVAAHRAHHPSTEVPP
jgi:hydrogenase maturation protease